MRSGEDTSAPNYVALAPMSAGRLIAGAAMPGCMTDPTPTQPVATEPTAQHADTLHVDYALKVRGREQVVCEIDGSAHMPYALRADTRRDTAANFNKLLGLLLLQPALLQVNGFVNGLRRADIEARENGEQAQPSPTTMESAPPTAEPQDAPPDLSPTEPPTPMTA